MRKVNLGFPWGARSPPPTPTYPDLFVTFFQKQKAHLQVEEFAVTPEDDFSAAIGPGDLNDVNLEKVCGGGGEAKC